MTQFQSSDKEDITYERFFPNLDRDQNTKKISLKKGYLLRSSASSGLATYSMPDNGSILGVVPVTSNRLNNPQVHFLTALTMLQVPYISRQKFLVYPIIFLWSRTLQLTEESMVSKKITTSQKLPPFKGLCGKPIWGPLLS
jgi:hypothetical protein